jgi:hypothetical protein
VHKNVVMDEKIQETVRGMVTELDHAWDKNMLPNRNFLIEKYPIFNEETIINFLKKYGRTEILSFRIMHEKPEYLWPILISRRYVKAKGKAMLAKAKHDADKQRKAMMRMGQRYSGFSCMMRNERISVLPYFFRKLMIVSSLKIGYFSIKKLRFGSMFLSQA